MTTPGSGHVVIMAKQTVKKSNVLARIIYRPKTQDETFDAELLGEACQDQRTKQSLTGQV